MRWIKYFIHPKRFDSEAEILTEQQKNCSHKWERMANSDYSHCLSCKLMRHDTDGDLINPLVYKEA